jgi:tRNA-dihydrouridine synthase B
MLAPMDGISDHPMRSLCRRMGSAISYTEFINVTDVLNHWDHLEKRIAFTEDERPLGFQLYGTQPQQFLQAALILLERHPDFFDVNLGCSVRRVAGRGAGAGLLSQPQVIAEVFRMLKSRIELPITAKMRLGEDEQHRNYLEIAHILEENGAAAIAVHARTRRQGYTAASDWSAITEIKAQVHIPVIGNGDVITPTDIERIRASTGCDAVMIGRAALGNPWIFQRVDKHNLERSEILRVVDEHWESMACFYGVEIAAFQFKKHLKAYLSCPQFSGLDLKAILSSPQPVDELKTML